jgi:hypothetical protein
MSTETQTKRRQDLKAKLSEAFADGAGENRRLSRADVERLGVPRRYVDSVVRTSARVVSTSDVKDAATEWTDTVADYLDAEDALTPADIIKSVDRIAARMSRRPICAASECRTASSRAFSPRWLTRTARIVPKRSPPRSSRT